VCASVLLVVAVSAVAHNQHQQVQEMFGIATVSEEVEASMEGTGVQVTRATSPAGSVSVANAGA